MIEKDFTYDTKDGWGGIFSDIICWVNFPCPTCKKYHSNNFLFDLKKGKIEYIGSCQMCGEQMKIKIPLEVNDKLCMVQQENLNKIYKNGNQGLEKWLTKGDGK